MKTPLNAILGILETLDLMHLDEQIRKQMLIISFSAKILLYLV